MICWRRQWHPTPVLLPGKSQGQRSLAGYCLKGCKESDMTEWLSMSTNNSAAEKHITWLKKWMKDMDKHFSKEDIQMANKYMERCSAWLVIKEVQIKTTMNYHLIPVRMAIIKKTRDNKNWQGCGEKGARCTVGGKVNWKSPSGKQWEDVSKN